MSTEAWILAALWLITTIIALFVLFRFHDGISREREEMFSERAAWRREWVDLLLRCESEREQWRAERQQLLDRIQSPSFAEYKQAEIKLEKIKNGEKEPPKLEPL